jgi:hypothetical protein
MMTELMSVLSLAAIAAFLLFPYNGYRVEKIRQQAFTLRDELFDEARKGNISFDSRAYMATRSLLNGLIRFSHRISFSRMIAFRCMLTDRAFVNTADGLAQAMNASAEQDRKLCTGYIRRANVLVAQHVLSSPLVLIFIIPPVMGVFLSKIGIDFAGRIVSLCKQQFADFDRIAFKEGQA